MLATIQAHPLVMRLKSFGLSIPRQYYSVGEQVSLSAVNMLASIVVVVIAGLAALGIYSFIYVISTLISSAIGTLLQRQMMLKISSSDEAERGSVFLSTVILQLALLTAVFVILLTIFSFLNLPVSMGEYKLEIVAAICFIGLWSLYELFKQYLYIVNEQRYSFFCTFLFVSVFTVSFVGIAAFVEPENVVAALYIACSVALLLSLLANRQCLSVLLSAKWSGIRGCWSVISEYFNGGKFALLGMLLTWMQNQSVNPFLMWVGGPLVAGYFSLARMFSMPMTVVNQGLVNSAAPGLRRSLQSQGEPELVNQISKVARQNLMLTLVYIAIMLGLHVSGLLARWIPDYQEIRWYLLIWIIATVFTMQRFWISQFFVTTMKFGFLLKISALSVAITVIGALFAGLVLHNVYLAVSCVIVGEVFTIVVLANRRRAELLKPSQSDTTSHATQLMPGEVS